MVQLRPFCSGCTTYYELGWASTGTQPDLSGSGNKGTVTGATVAAHVLKVRWP